MSFSKVVLIIVTLIVLDGVLQVEANEDLQVAESKSKKYPRHIQPNARPTQPRRRSYGRSKPARGRSDSDEDGGEEGGPSGYVILSYGGRLGKGSKGQRYGNKYGSDYSVEYVGNLYGYEDGHGYGYGGGYNNGYNSGPSSGYSSVTNIQHGTSIGDGSDENDGPKGNAEPTVNLPFVAVENGSDGTKDSGISTDDSIIIGADGVGGDPKGNADIVGEALAVGEDAIEETFATNGVTVDGTHIVAADDTGIEIPKANDEITVDSVITGGDDILSVDGTEIGEDTVGGDGLKGIEAMSEIVPLVEEDVTGSVVATKTIGTMDELMALLGDIGGSEGSTGPIKSMDDLIAIIGEGEGIEGISDITEFTGDTTGIDGSTGNVGSTDPVLDSFATGGLANDYGYNSGTGSVEEGATSFSAEEEYTFSVDLVTEDETIDQIASGKIVNTNHQNPFADSLVMDENSDLASVTADTVKASASYVDAANGAITIEENKSSSGINEKGESTFEPVEMAQSEALTAAEETGKTVIQPAEMVNLDEGTEDTSLIDTGNAPLSGSEKSSTPSIALEGNSHNQRRMGRNGDYSRRPVNYRNGDRRSLAVGKVNRPGNRARPQNRAINSQPVENLKYVNLPGNGEMVGNTEGKNSPILVRNVPMNKPSKQVPPSRLPVNGGSRFRSIGEGTSANRGMKESGPMSSKSVKTSPGHGQTKIMPKIVEMIDKETGPVSTKPLRAASNNPSGKTGSGKKRFLSMGKSRNTSGNSGKLESGSGRSKAFKNLSGTEEKVKKASGNGDKMNNHGIKDNRPARPAQLMSPPPSNEMMPPKPTMGESSVMASEDHEQGESAFEKQSSKGKGGKQSKNSVKEKRQISSSTSGSSSTSEKGKKGSDKGSGKETVPSESPVRTSSIDIEHVNSDDDGKQNNGFVRNTPLNIVRYLRKGIGRYL